MNANIEQEKSSKKKLIVPIVALMLCAVAVVGAGYAITTTVTDDNNTLDAKFGNIDLFADNSDSPTVVNTGFFTGAIVQIGKHTTVSDRDNNSVEVNAAAATKTTYLKVVGSAETYTITVELKDFFNNATGDALDTTVLAKYLTGITVKLGENDAVTLTATNTEASLGNVDEGELVKLVVTLNFNNGTLTGVSDADYDALVAAVDHTSFSLMFSTTVA